MDAGWAVVSGVGVSGFGVWHWTWTKFRQLRCGDSTRWKIHIVTAKSNCDQEVRYIPLPISPIASNWYRHELFYLFIIPSLITIPPQIQSRYPHLTSSSPFPKARIQHPSSLPRLSSLSTLLSLEPQGARTLAVLRCFLGVSIHGKTSPCLCSCLFLDSVRGGWSESLATLAALLIAFLILQFALSGGILEFGWYLSAWCFVFILFFCSFGILLLAGN